MENVKTTMDMLHLLEVGFDFAEKGDYKIEALSKDMQRADVQEKIADLEKRAFTDNLMMYDKEVLCILLKCALLIDNMSGYDTGMSDYTYDKLYEWYKKDFDPEFGFTVKVPDSNEKENHTFVSQRGTLDKIYYLDEEEGLNCPNKSRKGLPEWIKTAENAIHQATGERVNLMEEEVYIFPKFDGVSVIFEFSKTGELIRALLRGDTDNNLTANVTPKFIGRVKGPVTDSQYPYSIKTECGVLESVYEEYNKEHKTDFKSSRSLATSIINSDENDGREELLVLRSLRMSYLTEDGESMQELPKAAFKYPHEKCKLKDIEVMREFCEGMKKSGSVNFYSEDFRCDGMVIYLINPRLQKLLGRKDNKQKFEVAYKFTEIREKSTVKDVIWQVGKFGTLNPVLKFEPVKMKGNNVSRASLGSYALFKELNIHEGDEVTILYDIIPDTVFEPNRKVGSGKLFTAPDVCPDCDKPLEEDESGNILRCTYSKCPHILRGKILNYFEKMNIKNISYATVSDLYEAGLLKKISDIYKLEKNIDKILKIQGYKRKRVQGFIDEINSHREVEASVFLGSLGIEGVGRTIFKEVMKNMDYYTLRDVVKDEDVDKLVSIKGIGKITANAIIDNMGNMSDEIDKLEDYLKIRHEDIKDALYRVTFTNIRDDEMEKWISDHYGESGSFTSKTTVLCVPDSDTSEISTKPAEPTGKMKKAMEKNIPIVEISKLKEFILDKYKNLF